MRRERDVVLFFVIVFFVKLAVSKRFETRCKLVREFIRVGMPVDVFLGHWVCLVDQVNPNRNTNLLTGHGKKKAYGLYQIPSKWCKEGSAGGECNVKCEALLDDDLTDDTECTQTIFQREGLKIWRLWDIRCNNKDKREWYTNEIYKCPELSGLSPRISPQRLTHVDVFNRRHAYRLNPIRNYRYIS